MQEKPVHALDVPARKGQTIYPATFAAQVAGRNRRRLGEVFGLHSFGVNHTQLDPGAISALFHSHTVQDEFVYVLEGHPTVIIGDNEYELAPGDCVGFRAGTGIAHQIVNRTQAVVSLLEVGDRQPRDAVVYPHDDLSLTATPEGEWIVSHKDGQPY